MSDYSWVEKITAADITHRGLVLVSRFARMLKQIDGSILDLQDPNLATKVVSYGTKSDNARLKPLFDDLILEFEISLENRGEQRYRGALSHANRNEPKLKPSTNNDGESIKYYRGVPIINKAAEQAPQQAVKKTTYRGVDVMSED